MSNDPTRSQASQRSSAIKRKQWLYVGGALLAVGVVSIVGALVVSNEPRQTTASREAAKPKVVSVMTPGSTLTDKDGWRGQESARITDLNKQVQELNNRLVANEKNFTGMKADTLKAESAPKNIAPNANGAVQTSPPEAVNLGARPAGSNGGLAGVGGGTPAPRTGLGQPTGAGGQPSTTSPASPTPAFKQIGRDGKPVMPPGNPNGGLAGNPNPNQMAGANNPNTAQNSPMMIEKPASRIKRIALDEDEDDGENSSDPKVIAKRAMDKASGGKPSQPTSGEVIRGADWNANNGGVKFDKNKKDVDNYIPSGSFMKGRVLGGMDAPTGGQAQNNPVPMLVQITDNAFLPSRMRSEVKECFVVGTGFGDISSERAHLRTESISCIKEDGTAIDMPIRGYISGEDGKAGMRGKLVSKQGQILANALTAALVSGLGQAITLSASTQTANPLGGVTTTPNAGQGFQAGFGTGFGRAADKLAQYYINLADKIFPIIEIDAGREVTVVLTRGTFIDNRPAPPIAASSGTSTYR
jgi:Bacterial conjugation TrbI-like protein